MEHMLDRYFGQHLRHLVDLCRRVELFVDGRYFYCGGIAGVFVGEGEK